MDEHARESLAGPHPVRRPRRLERADDRRADRDDAMARPPRGVHQSRRLLRYLERLRVDGLLFDSLRLDLEAADACMEQDGREPNAGGREGFLDPWRDRPSRRWHLGAAGDAGEEAPVRVERPGLRDVPVVDRGSLPLQDRLERPVRVDEPQPRDAGIRRDERHGRVANGGVLPRADRHRSRMSGVPPGLREPEALRVTRAEIERVRSRGAAGHEARGQGRALICHEEIACGQEPRQVLERRVGGPFRRCDEEPHLVTGTALEFRGGRCEQFTRLFEREFLSIQAGTSQTAPCASNLWPVTRAGSCPSSQAQNGSVTSGRGRSRMSWPGNASWCIWVRRSPGSTATTPTPASRNSFARVFETSSSAALLEPYPPHPG